MPKWPPNRTGKTLPFKQPGRMIGGPKFSPYRLRFRLTIVRTLRVPKGRADDLKGTIELIQVANDYHSVETAGTRPDPEDRKSELVTLHCTLLREVTRAALDDKQAATAARQTAQHFAELLGAKTASWQLFRIVEDDEDNVTLQPVEKVQETPNRLLHP